MTPNIPNTHTSEVWKPVSGFEGRYEVSCFGRVRGLPREILYKDGRRGQLKGSPIKGVISATGYAAVTLDSKHRRLVHRLVAESFLEPQEFRRTVNHINGDKLDNRLENLEWATYGENNDHARSTGLNRQRGENCNLTKYPDTFIRALRNVHAKYKPSWEELGRLFGVRGAHARQIALGLTRRLPTG